MNGAEVLAQHDPGFLKARRRERAWIVGLGLLAIVAAIVAVLAIIGTIKTETKITKLQPRVTKIERTPCTRDPNGRECQELRAEIEEQANQRVTCIPFHKAGYPCPLPGSEFVTDAASKPNGRSVPDQSAGGDANQSPSPKGHQQPAPHPGGSPEPAAEQPLGAKQSPSEGNSAPSPSPATPEGKGPVEAAGQAATEAVGGILGGTTETVCRVTQSC